MPHDPWLLLSKLAQDGLERVAVEVGIDGQRAFVTDRALEVALSGAAPKNPSAEEQSAIRAAMAIVEFDAASAQDVADRARAGDESAARIYQALVLRELVRLRIVARRIVARMRKGDAGASASATQILAIALQPEHPLYSRARASAFLLRDAMRERMIDVEPEHEDEEEQAPASTPANDTSAHEESAAAP